MGIKLPGGAEPSQKPYNKDDVVAWCHRVIQSAKNPQPLTEQQRSDVLEGYRLLMADDGDNELRDAIRTVDDE